MKLPKKQNNVLVSSLNLEGHCDLEWNLCVDPWDLALSIELPSELCVNYSVYNDNLDKEENFNKIINITTTKLAKIELVAQAAIFISKIEITDGKAKVYLSNESN